MVNLYTAFVNPQYTILEYRGITYRAIQVFPVLPGIKKSNTDDKVAVG
jgi:hypothetical protein